MVLSDQVKNLDWRVFSSPDLLRWSLESTLLPNATPAAPGDYSTCWATDAAAGADGAFYFYLSLGANQIGVMRGATPVGPWEDPLGTPLINRTLGASLHTEARDPCLFVDDDGTPYIINGDTDYQIARLKDSMTELDETPRRIEIDRKGVFPCMDKNSLHKHNGIYYLSCSGYYATSRNLYGPYEYQGLVGTGWGLDTPFGHGDFFTWKGDWYHVWCKYRDRSHDRIRDCFIAPVV